MHYWPHGKNISCHHPRVGFHVSNWNLKRSTRGREKQDFWKENFRLTFTAIIIKIEEEQDDDNKQSRHRVVDLVIIIEDCDRKTFLNHIQRDGESRDTYTHKLCSSGEWRRWKRDGRLSGESSKEQDMLHLLLLLLLLWLQATTSYVYTHMIAIGEKQKQKHGLEGDTEREREGRVNVERKKREEQ